ncbi:MAG TPA: AAC(3) family N-acetyltransferase, partial [Candidatus Methanofastidiosa archaeon]|nr:AAC(3) family N-acetyltransferase [Candidatus Methanofastidiosa archaeon]
TVLFVQSSLSSIGWVCGGAVAVIQALLNTIGDEGTLVMPCMSSDWSDPSRWENPPVPMGWWDIIKDCMPPFDKDVTPARKMGAVANAFRCWPGVVRSDHPISFIAGGKHSRYVVEGQPLSFPMGAGSPLERCCEMDGYGLLIGTERNTTLHLAEYRACFTKKTVKNGVPMIRNGRREWCEYEEYEDYTEHFPKILSEFSGTGRCKMGMIGNAKSHLFKQSDIVDYGKEWFERNLN